MKNKIFFDYLGWFGILSALSFWAYFKFLAPEYDYDSRAMLLIPFFLCLVSILIAVGRGGILRMPLILLLPIVYPLLAPVISQDILGFKYTSLVGITYQTVAHEMEPLLFGSIICLAVASFVSNRKIVGTKLQARTYGLGVNTLIFSGFLAIFFAWLAEPSLTTVFTSSYGQIIDSRIQGTEFSGGAWCVVIVFMTAAKQSVDSSPWLGPKKKLFCKRFFWFVVFFTIAYLVLHARRSEPAGLLLFLLLIYGSSFNKRVVVTIGTLLLVSFTVVEILRGTSTTEFSKLYYGLPGGAGQVLAGYLVTYWEYASMGLSYPGQTYVAYILSLPPSFLGLDRPYMVYDYILDIENLSGGIYILNEPIVNFGLVGGLILMGLYIACANKVVKSMDFYKSGRGSLLSYMLSGVFVALIFRTTWYGSGALVKGLVIALLIVGAYRIIPKK